MNIFCPICSRDTPDCYQDEHHLIPKAKKGTEKVPICIDCHRSLHQFFTNNELKKTYNTIDKIRNATKIITWVEWVQKRPTQFNFCMKRKK